MPAPRHRMARDRARFRGIVRGRLREDLRQYLCNSEWVGRQNGRQITIPIPQISLPRLRFGEGQGGKEGSNGRSDGGADGDQGLGSGRRGAGDHSCPAAQRPGSIRSKVLSLIR